MQSLLQDTHTQRKICLLLPSHGTITIEMMSDWNIGLFGDFHIGLFSCGVCVPCNESKVCLLLPLHSAITTEIIFENVYCRRHYTRKRANAHTKSADTRWSKIICHAELWALRSSTAYQSADLRVWEVWRFIGFAPLNLQTFRSYSTSDNESCPCKYEWVMSLYMNESCHCIWMSHVTVYEWVMSLYMNKACHCIWIRHETYST